MSASETLQKCVTIVVRPKEQQPDIEQVYYATLRPRLLGITYSWTAEELRGTEGDMHGEVEVRVQGDQLREGKLTPGGEVHLRWEKLESWPLWVKVIVGEEAPHW